VRRAATTALLAWLAAAPARAHEPALPPLGFEPPAPGTYTLHRIMRAPAGEVLDLQGRARPLTDFTHGRITVLGLVYTTCVDPEGCPLTLPVFEAIRTAVGERPHLRPHVRLVSLSFDPERDTPAAMRAYAGRRAQPHTSGVPWYFLTARSTRAARPLLDGFGQDARSVVLREGGGTRREISHILKVFLIDQDGYIREIYSSTSLHSRTVLNDIETLVAAR
jgi:protein SCO1